MGEPVPTLEMSGRTDVGCARSSNEDSIAWHAAAGLALLADGMGGHNAGEVASAIAIDILDRLLQQVASDLQSREQAVHNAVAEANSAILDKAGSQPAYQGMGTTLALALFRDDTVTISHVGDSRVYLLRDGEMQRLTTDHSLLQELVDGGFMSAEEAEEAVSKNIITRALGIEPTVVVDSQCRTIRSGDLFLLCSDGLTDMVSDNAIAKILKDNVDNIDTIAEALVAEANRNGGDDNISVILVRVRALTSSAT